MLASGAVSTCRGGAVFENNDITAIIFRYCKQRAEAAATVNGGLCSPDRPRPGRLVVSCAEPATPAGQRA